MIVIYQDMDLWRSSRLINVSLLRYFRICNDSNSLFNFIRPWSNCEIGRKPVGGPVNFRPVGFIKRMTENFIWRAEDHFMHKHLSLFDFHFAINMEDMIMIGEISKKQTFQGVWYIRYIIGNYILIRVADDGVTVVGRVMIGRRPLLVITSRKCLAGACLSQFSKLIT